MRMVYFVSLREHHCLMALALAVQAISLRQNAAILGLCVTVWGAVEGWQRFVAGSRYRRLDLDLNLVLKRPLIKLWVAELHIFVFSDASHS
jgi:hypothetical protein